eukprot:CAMPEP_0184311670 /NCGR_PEP_ID=MMETSP1049-20130417/43846_1 /TAXON_ID=77928 /ORGANISM="Proteomonas sulcata, Strain CCMP704" /LENGTH=68 /DNA_ID=CAMNT_0026627233 /DNA_START=160 /DNA_END=366 /DNA_ORIENTATION=+
MFALLSYYNHGYNCMPTYANWNCNISPLPGDYGAYHEDVHKSEEPAGGGEVYWEHQHCTLSKRDGTCL